MSSFATKRHKLYKYMKFHKYLMASSMNERIILNDSNPILLDTSIGSDNAGDHIIMHFAEKQLEKIWPQLDDRLPTHIQPTNIPSNTQDRLKILCGTNAISARAEQMRSAADWLDLPFNTTLYAHSILTLAVGLRDVQPNGLISSKTAKVLRYLLTSQYVHSVRDSATQEALKQIGINNVINTSCVTMWDLTPEFCKTIPTDKATDVLTTITDYGFDPDNDAYMLKALKKHYRKVYLWLQGVEDRDRLQQLSGLDDIEYIEGGFAGLQHFVDNHDDFDYFGTRLHCGIYCMNHKIRSMIVTIDNRAADIQKDTNIPTVDRTDLKRDMERLIEEPRMTDITIPQSSIAEWKNQFISQ